MSRRELLAWLQDCPGVGRWTVAEFAPALDSFRRARRRSRIMELVSALRLAERTGDL